MENICIHFQIAFLPHNTKTKTRQFSQFDGFTYFTTTNNKNKTQNQQETTRTNMLMHCYNNNMMKN